MSNFNQRYNFDNVMVRANVVGLLAELNKVMYYYQQNDEHTNVKIQIPVLYSVTGGEQFLRDEFVYKAVDEGHPIGDYEKSPRCVINMTGISINESEQTNKYIRTRFNREVNGVLRTCFLMTNFVPITLSFDGQILCANTLELLKATECVISKIYKNPKIFDLNLGPFVTQAAYTCPTDFSHTKPTEFSVNDRKEFNINFSIEMKSFLPCFEHGLLLQEIDNMLASIPDNTKAGVVEFRPNKYGEMEMRLGGIIEQATANAVHRGNIETHRIVPQYNDLKI